MIQMDKPQFTIANVAKAAGIEVNTLRSWFQRGHFALGKTDKRADEFGDAHLLSLRTALRVGVAVEMHRSGVHPARAAKLALDFTLLGSVDQKTQKTTRASAELFEGAGVYTAMVVYPGIDEAEVVRFTDKTPSLHDSFMSRGHGRRPSALIVWLNDIDLNMRRKLPEVE